MEPKRICKICGEEKPIYEFGKKDKFKYRTECKVCYNKSRRDFNKLSEEEKIKVKNDSKIKEEQRRLEIKKRREEMDKEKENKKIEKYERLLREYEERMKEKINKREIKLKNYLCEKCGESDYNSFYPKRKNKCKRCIILDSKETYLYEKMNTDEKKVYIEKQKDWRSKNIIKYRVLCAKHRSLKKNISFEIDEEIITKKLEEQGGKCYISKQQLTFNENDWYGLSLDRLDSNLGYTVDNTILVTKFVNTSKNNLSYGDYVKLLKEVCDNV